MQFIHTDSQVHPHRYEDERTGEYAVSRCSLSRRHLVLSSEEMALPLPAMYILQSTRMWFSLQTPLILFIYHSSTCCPIKSDWEASLGDVVCGQWSFCLMNIYSSCWGGLNKLRSFYVRRKVCVCKCLCLPICVFTCVALCSDFTKSKSSMHQFANIVIRCIAFINMIQSVKSH